MTGIDTHTAAVSQREPFAFSESSIERILTEIKNMPEVNGAVMLATCNRTELYLSVNDECQFSPKVLLMRYAGENADENILSVMKDDEAALHLIEVACGLHSKILHEEQIVTQVRNAVAFARGCHSTDSLLDTLFRTAVSAGKYALTNVKFSSVPLSVSYGAVQLLEREIGDLSGKKAVVIGNGNMGRLAARLLIEKNCRVFVTLRTYKHGETIVPFGAVPIPYESRFDEIDGSDIVISATRSPHYTITFDELFKIKRKPQWLLDLAVPRDIEQKCGDIESVNYQNIDDLGNGAQLDTKYIQELSEISARFLTDFQQWKNYRDSVPYINQIKEIVAQRIIRSDDMNAYRDYDDCEEIVNFVTEKTVDIIMGSMRSQIEPELIKNCCEKIENRARI